MVVIKFVDLFLFYWRCNACKGIENVAFIFKQECASCHLGATP